MLLARMGGVSLPAPPPVTIVQPDAALELAQPLDVEAPAPPADEGAAEPEGPEDAPPSEAAPGEPVAAQP